MKLSIVVICWNNWNVIEDCLRSVIAGTHKVEYEIIVADNGSSDGSVEQTHAQFPSVRVVENRANLGFSKGNNAGIREARGEYVLILNPDTIVHDGSLDLWVEFADRHRQAGAFGCRVNNSDGTYQISARPFPTISRCLMSALGLRFLAQWSSADFVGDYEGWMGDTEREVDWQSGCCVLFRGDLLKELGGFDDQFFFQFDEVDLCRRVWKAGYTIRFTPTVSITHLGGQSVGRLAPELAIEICRNGYRYFYKYCGSRGAKQFRRVVLIRYRIRQAKYGLLNLFQPNTMNKSCMEMNRITALWNQQLDAVEFVRHGTEGPIKQVPLHRIEEG